MTLPDDAEELLAAYERMRDARAARYAADPVGWTAERAGAFLWSKQREIINAVRTHKKVAVQSAHNVGKSYVAGTTGGWWIDTHPAGEAFLLTTAPGFTQVKAILWKELRRVHRAAGLLGRTNQTEWYIDDELVGMGRKPADYDEHAFQGIHAPFVLVIIDEACGVPASIFTAADTIASNRDSHMLAIGNPDDPNTEFGRICQPGSGWHVIRINGLETPNFTDEQIPDEVARNLLDPDWVEDKRRRWGETNPLFISKVLGLFPENSEDTLISGRWVTDGINLELEPGDPTVIAVDPARFGADESVIGVRQGGKCRIVWASRATAITEVTGKTVEAFRRYGGEVNVDEVGLGAGVVDSLREQGIPVNGLNGGAQPKDTDRFFNARAEWWWMLREALEAGELDIPDDDELAAQLQAPKWTTNSRGRIVLESKDDMKKRGVESPDRGDVLAMLLVAPPPRVASFTRPDQIRRNT